jgi:hypothetical protein
MEAHLAQALMDFDTGLLLTLDILRKTRALRMPQPGFPLHQAAE